MTGTDPGSLESAPPSIVFVGPMGAGKTSIGRRVAKSLGLAFADTDALIVREHGPIPDLFATQGESAFRAIERDVVRDALARGTVVALGGGAVLDEGTRRALSAHHVIFLTVGTRQIKRRLGTGQSRPLVAGDDPVPRWEQIFTERKPLYDEVSDVVFDTSRAPMTAIATDIAEWARKRLASPVGEQSKG